MLDKTGLFLIGHRGAFSFDFEVKIAIQQAVSKVAMSGAYIREGYTYYCTSGSYPKNPPDPGVRGEMKSLSLALNMANTSYGLKKCFLQSPEIN